jgi:hypothetical protein
MSTRLGSQPGMPDVAPATWFAGVTFYSRQPFGRTATGLVAVLGLARRLLGDDGLSFVEATGGPGLALKERKLADVALPVLEEEIRAGVVTGLEFFEMPRRKRGRVFGSTLRITFKSEATSIYEPDCPYSLYLTSTLDRLDPRGPAYHTLESLMALLDSPYGVVYVDPELGNVHQEAHVLPRIPLEQLVAGGSRADPRTVGGHVQRVQVSRQPLGSKVRGAYWGNFFGPALVAGLGGRDSVARAAPVSAVRPLAGGGAYLQLAIEPVARGLEHDAEYAVLETYLAPVLAWPVTTSAP